MAGGRQIGTEVEALRGLIAGLTLEMKVLRLRHILTRKYDPGQPRAPAGQPNGGQWVSEDSAGSGATVDPAQLGPTRWSSLAAQDEPAAKDRSRERTLLGDGTEVLTIRIHAGPRVGDEEHTVTSPDGESRVFETSGDTQTIRHGATGEILGRSTWTDVGPVAEAFPQSAFLPAATAVVRTIELGALLFSVLSARRSGFGTVIGLTAQEYRVGTTPAAHPVVWVGVLTQKQLDAACPRNGDVQAIGDTAAADIRRLFPQATGKRFGDLMHYRAEEMIKALKDPNLLAELSLERTGPLATRNQAGSVRLDVFENNQKRTVCVYDFKTGNAQLSPGRALELVVAAGQHFIGTLRVIIIQVKPR
ncbi:hypothetical protein [Methylobacterium sp. A54F]